MKSHPRSARTAVRLAGLSLAVTTVAGVLATLPPSPAAAASATNVSRSGTIVTITAGAATTNDVSVFLDENNEITVTDAAGIVDVSGDGCTVFFGNTAKCGTGATLVSAFLGDGNDEIQLESPVNLVVNGESGNDTLFGGMARGGATSTTFRGGTGADTASYVNADRFVTVSLDDVARDGRPGDTDDIRSDVENLTGSRFPDTLTGSAANNVLDGRTSNDRLSGLGGNDTFPEGVFASGADDFSGGEGQDLVSYFSRRAGVTVNLDGVADDGAAGEFDNVRGDVEIVTSGTGSDVLIGNAAANKFDSSGGTDRMEGRGGADSLFAVDNLAGFGGPDTVLGGAGNDRIDVVDESGGDDVRCGAGTADSAFIDAGQDTALACELVGTT